MVPRLDCWPRPWAPCRVPTPTSPAPPSPTPRSACYLRQRSIWGANGSNGEAAGGGSRGPGVPRWRGGPSTTAGFRWPSGARRWFPGCCFAGGDGPQGEPETPFHVKPTLTLTIRQAGPVGPIRWLGEFLGGPTRWRNPPYFPNRAGKLRGIHHPPRLQRRERHRFHVKRACRKPERGAFHVKQPLLGGETPLRLGLFHVKRVP